MKVFVVQKPIKEPYWNEKAAGLNTLFFIDADYVHFTCSYRNNSGVALFPHLYEVDVKRAKSVYKTHQVRFHKFGKETLGPLLYLCPFSDLKIVKEGVTKNVATKSSKRIKSAGNRAGAPKSSKKAVEAQPKSRRDTPDFFGFGETL